MGAMFVFTFFVALPLCRALFLPCMTEAELCMSELFDTRCFDCKNTDLPVLGMSET